MSQNDISDITEYEIDQILKLTNLSNIPNKIKITPLNYFESNWSLLFYKLNKSNESKESNESNELKESNIRELYINNNNIGDFLFYDKKAELSIYLIEYLKNNSILTKLFLDKCNINDDGATAISKGLKHNKNLVVLSLESNFIGDIGVENLCKGIKKNNTIKKFNINKNNIINGINYLINLKNEKQDIEIKIEKTIITELVFYNYLFKLDYVYEKDEINRQCIWRTKKKMRCKNFCLKNKDEESKDVEIKGYDYVCKVHQNYWVYKLNELNIILEKEISNFNNTTTIEIKEENGSLLKKIKNFFSKKSVSPSI